MNIQKIVSQICSENVSIGTNLLLIEVYKRCGVSSKDTFNSVLNKIENKQLPSIETIFRTKRWAKGLNIKCPPIVKKKEPTQDRLSLIKKIHAKHKNNKKRSISSACNF